MSLIGYIASTSGLKPNNTHNVCANNGPCTRAHSLAPSVFIAVALLAFQDQERERAKKNTEPDADARCIQTRYNRERDERPRASFPRWFARPPFHFMLASVNHTRERACLCLLDGERERRSSLIFPFSVRACE